MSKPTIRAVSRPATLLIGALTLLIAPPIPAAAQFGGLARRARDAAEQKAEKRVEEELPYQRLPAPEFDGRVLEVSGDRLDGLLRGLAAEVEFAAQAGAEYDAEVKAYEAAMAEHERAVEAYDAELDKYGECVERFDAREDKARAANDAKLQKAIEDMDDDEFEAYAEDLARRGEEIERDVEAGKRDDATLQRQREYMAEVAALQVEQSRRIQLALSGSLAEQHRSSTEEARLLAACGSEPERPAEMESSLTGPEGVLSRHGAQAAGLTGDQYAIMRERVLYWSSQDGRPTGMGFSDTEMSALAAHKEALERATRDMDDANVPW